MNGGRWGHEGPPLEAYERVTNPERFEPMHRDALARLDQLEKQFDVERVEGYALDKELERAILARPSVKLIPPDPNAAPLTLAFTSFPGVAMRCGLWLVLYFPSCGCDACDETVESEQQRMTEAIDAVAHGRFREWVRIPLLGAAKQGWEMASSGSTSSGGTILNRSQARSLLREVSSTHDWAPWPIR